MPPAETRHSGSQSVNPDDLMIEFLEAQLAADEQTARAAQPGPWTIRQTGRHDLAAIVEDTGRQTRHGVPIGPAIASLDGSAATRNGRHIARHDPARVLREIKADRDLIAAYREARAYYGANPHAPAGELHGLLTALKIRAARFDRQPGYQEEWRP
ncbi:DUF6221 family protein (plasmid) [Microtetraspora malaysiensis]|uniref:DUF6221 family protein n=1 Tax=Microtetraspora malaysiensis TaxID=161358 RepID=UPI003D91F91C